MMREVAKLTAGSDGRLSEDDYNRTVETLLAGGSDPVISEVPQNAWTSAVTDKMGM
jgi:NitT/TauT family transport system substrate-binding protein